MLEVGDKVKLFGCPYDEQITDEAVKFAKLEEKVQTVTDVKDTTHIKGTTGQWVKTDFEPEWTDKAWYKAI
jgi:hypothetical protein